MSLYIVFSFDRESIYERYEERDWTERKSERLGVLGCQYHTNTIVYSVTSTIQYAQLRVLTSSVLTHTLRTCVRGLRATSRGSTTHRRSRLAARAPVLAPALRRLRRRSGSTPAVACSRAAGRGRPREKHRTKINNTKYISLRAESRL